MPFRPAGFPGMDNVGSSVSGNTPSAPDGPELLVDARDHLGQPELEKLAELGLPRRGFSEDALEVRVQCPMSSSVSFTSNTQTRATAPPISVLGCLAGPSIPSKLPSRQGGERRQHTL